VLSNSKEEVKLVLLYGYGGPVRDSLVCFSGEYVYVSVQIPKGLIQGITRIGCDWKFTSQSDKNYYFRNPQTVSYSTSLPVDSAPFFLMISQQIPDNAPEGKYDLNVTIKDLEKGWLVVDKTETIEIKGGESFGLRNVTFLHGLTRTDILNPPRQSYSGSNIFIAGEQVAIFFSIGGIPKRINNKLEVKTTLTLFDDVGRSIEIFSESYANNSNLPGDTRHPLSDTYQIPIAMPGKYRVEIVVQQLFSTERVCCKLPLLLLPPQASSTNVLVQRLSNFLSGEAVQEP